MYKLGFDFCYLVNCPFQECYATPKPRNMYILLYLIFWSLIISTIIFAICVQSIQRANTNSRHARHNQKTLSVYLHTPLKPESFSMSDIKHVSAARKYIKQNSRQSIITKLECSKFIQLLYREFRMYLVVQCSIYI